MEIVCKDRQFLRVACSTYKWVEESFQCNEGFIKRYNDDSDEGYFIEVDVQYPENLHNLQNDLAFFA